MQTVYHLTKNPENLGWKAHSDNGHTNNQVYVKIYGIDLHGFMNLQPKRVTKPGTAEYSIDQDLITGKFRTQNDKDRQDEMNFLTKKYHGNLQEDQNILIGVFHERYFFALAKQIENFASISRPKEDK